MTILPWQQHRVLQQHVLLLFLLLLRALQQHEEVVTHKKPSDRVVGGARLCEQWVLAMCLMGRNQLSHGIQTGKTNEKPTSNVKNSCQRSVYMHVLVRNNTWAGPRNCRAGPYRARVSWASLPCDGPGRTGPRRLQK